MQLGLRPIHKSSSAVSVKSNTESVSLRDRVLEILIRSVEPSQRKEEFINLSRQANCPLLAIEQLAAIIENEVECVENRADIAAEIDGLLEAVEASVDIRSVLPADEGYSTLSVSWMAQSQTGSLLDNLVNSCLNSSQSRNYFNP